MVSPLDIPYWMQEVVLAGDTAAVDSVVSYTGGAVCESYSAEADCQLCAAGIEGVPVSCESDTILEAAEAGAELYGEGGGATGDSVVLEATGADVAMLYPDEAAAELFEEFEDIKAEMSS